MRAMTLCLFCLWPLRLPACELALVLAVDVSGSVDRQEYRTQMDGLALALRDGAVAEALVALRARVAVLQWTGASRQRVTVAWRDMTGFDAVETLAVEIEQDVRVWRNFSTAIGEALSASAALFDQVPECSRRVIDVSGDGVSNEGIAPGALKPELARAGITVNALAIEGADVDLTGYFYENVIFGDGAFVTTARGYRDYPARIRQKLLRELTKQVSQTSGHR